MADGDLNLANAPQWLANLVAEPPLPQMLRPVGVDQGPGEEGAGPAPPDWRSFVGYFGGEIEYRNRMWTRLYLDLDLQSWLIIESAGVLQREDVHNEPGVAPGRVVLWVRPDAAVGRGKRSLSVEGEFLTGEFTRAGDFDLGTAAGTPAAATGVFCDARSVGCCMGRTNRPPGG